MTAQGFKSKSFPSPAKERLILVEGDDDVQLVEALCSLAGVGEVVQAISFAEISKLTRVVDVLVRDSEFGRVKHLGLMKDANGDFKAANDSLSAAWARAQKILGEIGLVKPKCTLFVAPDNAGPGRIENLCCSAPAYPPIMECARAAFECAMAVSPHPIDKEKAIVSAYLAMMKKTGLRLGVGAKAGCWDLGAAAFGPLTGC